MKTADAATDYLTWCAVHGYSEGTLRARRYYLASFLSFLDERELFDVESVTPSALDSYQRHLYHQKKTNGLPLSFRTQAQRLIPVKGLFAWLTRTGVLPYDPSISLVLPKVEHRVPEAVLSIDEVEAILAGPATGSSRPGDTGGLLLDGDPPCGVAAPASCRRRPRAPHGVRASG